MVKVANGDYLFRLFLVLLRTELPFLARLPIQNGQPRTGCVPFAGLSWPRTNRLVCRSLHVGRFGCVLRPLLGGINQPPCSVETAEGNLHPQTTQDEGAHSTSSSSRQNSCPSVDPDTVTIQFVGTWIEDVKEDCPQTPNPAGLMLKSFPDVQSLLCSTIRITGWGLFYMSH